MSQAQLSFIGKIKAWFKSLLQKKEEFMETVEEVIETVEKVEADMEIINPKAAKKIKDASKTIDETIKKVRGSSVAFDKAANLSEAVLDSAEVVVSSFKKGRFEETEIATITNAIALAGKLDVDWNTLSTNLNRDIKSIKAKAKLLSK